MSSNHSTNHSKTTLNFMPNPKKENEQKRREHKGKSLLFFPNDYIVMDLETTGLSPEYDSIIEICALKYENQILTDKFSTLINPGYEIDDFIIELTGITNEMLLTAPSIQKVINSLDCFLGNSIIVGHSVNFDINFIYDIYESTLSKPFCNDFIDTLRLSRRMHSEHKHNRLIDLSARYNLSYDNAHRAEFDCLLTNKVFNIFRSEFVDLHGSTENAESILHPHKRNNAIKVDDIKATKTSFDETHPLFEKTVVFTGTLEKMNRKSAMQIVVDFGGKVSNSITKATNYLILGNNDYCPLIKDGKSSKQKRAETLKLSGNDIEIIPENVFYDMISEI